MGMPHSFWYFGIASVWQVHRTRIVEGTDFPNAFMPSLPQAQNSVHNTAVPAACCFDFHKLYPAIPILNTHDQVTSMAFSSRLFLLQHLST